MKIRDGKGTGNEAKVDDHGRLYTKADQVSHMAHHSSYHKNSFMVPATLTTADGNEAPLFFIKNTTTDSDISLYNLYLSSESNVFIQMYQEGTYSSGGSALSPVNLNLASSQTKSVEVYEGTASDNLVITTTDSSKMWHTYLGANAPQEFNLDGMIIIPPGKSVFLTATGVASDVVKMSLAYTWHTTEGQ